jgi:hypothetical protein
MSMQASPHSRPHRQKRLQRMKIIRYQSLLPCEEQASHIPFAGPFRVYPSSAFCGLLRLEQHISHSTAQSPFSSPPPSSQRSPTFSGQYMHDLMGCGPWNPHKMEGRGPIWDLGEMQYINGTLLRRTEQMSGPIVLLNFLFTLWAVPFANATF